MFCFFNILSSACLSALVVRFLTRRFIGDYERNVGELRNRIFYFSVRNMQIWLSKTRDTLDIKMFFLVLCVQVTSTPEKSRWMESK